MAARATPEEAVGAVVLYLEVVRAPGPETRFRSRRTRRRRPCAKGSSESPCSASSIAPPSDAIHDAVMRTTIDLPDDLHRAVTVIARDRHQTLSRTVESLMRAALTHDDRTPVEIDPDSGLPTVRIGRRITAEDVAAIEEDG